MGRAYYNTLCLVLLIFFIGMPRTAEQIQHQKNQAKWFQICSLSHSQFCNCGDWIYHIKKYLWPTMQRDSDLPPIRPDIVDKFIIAGGGDGFGGGEGTPGIGKEPTTM